MNHFHSLGKLGKLGKLAACVCSSSHQHCQLHFVKAGSLVAFSGYSANSDLC